MAQLCAAALQQQTRNSNHGDAWIYFGCFRSVSTFWNLLFFKIKLKVQTLSAFLTLSAKKKTPALCVSLVLCRSPFRLSDTTTRLRHQIAADCTEDTMMNHKCFELDEAAAQVKQRSWHICQVQKWKASLMTRSIQFKHPYWIFLSGMTMKFF